MDPAGGGGSKGPPWLCCFSRWSAKPCACRACLVGTNLEAPAAAALQPTSTYWLHNLAQLLGQVASVTR